MFYDEGRIERTVLAFGIPRFLMGISRLHWGLTLIAGGVLLSSLRWLPPPTNRSIFAWQDQLFGAGLVAVFCYLAGAAFLIQHYRHRHDFDEEEDRRE